MTLVDMVIGLHLWKAGLQSIIRFLRERIK